MDASDASQPETTDAGAGAQDAAAPPPKTAAEAIRAGWRAPLLAGGLALFGSGLVAAVLTAPQPDYTGDLDAAAAQIDELDYPAAIETLNTRVLPRWDERALTLGDRQRFHVLMGRALYRGNLGLELPQEVNDQNAIAQFLEAERLEARLLPEDEFALADAYARLRAFEKAEARVDRIPDDRADLRYRAYRGLVDARLSAPGADGEEVLGVLGRLLADPGLPDEHRIWALVRQSDVRDALGYHDETITQLLRQIPSMLDRGPEALAGLYVALGRAYTRVGALEQAQLELGRVQSETVVPAGTDLRARLLRWTGELGVRTATGPTGLGGAREAFAEVVRAYSDTPQYAPALLGLAEVDAALENVPASLESYETLVQSLREGTGPAEPSKTAVADSLLQRFGGHLSRGSDGASHALAFATQAGNLFELDETPPRVLEALAVAHRASAARLLGVALAPAGAGDGGASGDPFAAIAGADLFDLATLDPATRLQVKRHLIRAAAYFREHADRFVIDDLPRYADSLWSAATMFDLAGDRNESIRAYEEFERTVPNEDRVIEASFRLAQAYQAAGDYTTAVGFYRGLLERASAEGVRRVGPWADRSRVPLARALLDDGDPENDAEAETLLADVVAGRAGGGPSADGFDDALLEYAALLRRTGRLPDAIRRAGEFLERFPNHRRELDAMYGLADAHRVLAAELEERIAADTRASERRRLEAERVMHLGRALELFVDVRDRLASADPRRRTELQRVQLRNAHFYAGDAAFDVGDLDAAIAHYSVARERYADDPAVLVALIQIVSAYIQKGDLASARTANERARDFYRSVPEEAWDDPSLPMDRQDWERWLDSSSRLHEELARGA